MKRVLLILLIFSLFNRSVDARETERGSRFTFGLEWNYIATLHYGFHFNYFAPEGFRVDDADHFFGYWNNADMNVHIGWNINPTWNLSMYLGYAGVGNIHNVIPISLRATRYFGKDPLSDRWFAFAEAGSGICIKSPVQEILIGKTGFGYRLSLSPDTKLDFILSARTTYTHPHIYYDGIQISSTRINRNNAYLSALSIGMAITF